MRLGNKYHRSDKLQTKKKTSCDVFFSNNGGEQGRNAVGDVSIEHALAHKLKDQAEAAYQRGIYYRKEDC